MPAATAFQTTALRTVDGRVNYIGQMVERPRYYANDHSRDVLSLDPRTIQIEDARGRTTPPSLEPANRQAGPRRASPARCQHCPPPATGLDCRCRPADI